MYALRIFKSCVWWSVMMLIQCEEDVVHGDGGKDAALCLQYSDDVIRFLYKDCNQEHGINCTKIWGCPKECVSSRGDFQNIGHEWREKRHRCRCIDASKTSRSPEVPTGAAPFPPQKLCVRRGCSHPFSGQHIPRMSKFMHNRESCQCVKGPDPTIREVDTLYHIECVPYVYAHCQLQIPGPKTTVTEASNIVSGSVDFKQLANGGHTYIKISLETSWILDVLQFEFSVHEFGEVWDGCENTGMIFKPTAGSHRLVGLLGVVNVTEENFTVQQILKTHIALAGPYNVVGRSVVVREVTGQHNHDESNTIGGRKCCSISLTSHKHWE